MVGRKVRLVVKRLRWRSSVVMRAPSLDSKLANFTRYVSGSKSYVWNSSEYRRSLCRMPCP